MAIGRVNTGGGAGLNYKVVRVASLNEYPLYPKENTIAIVAIADITDHVFALGMPAVLNGRVWIQTSTASAAPINVLKKNGAWVYPINAFQCVDGGYRACDVAVYQNEEWRRLVFPLFWRGDECIAATGGWNIKPDGGSPTFTKTGSSLKIKTNGSAASSGGFITANTINFAALGIKTLKARINVITPQSADNLIYLSASAARNTQPNVYTPPTPSGEKVMTLDISSLAAARNAYVIHWKNNSSLNSECEFLEVWGEYI